MKKALIAVFVGLFLWGFFLRSVEVINGNYLFGHDHGRDYLAAYDIVKNHKLTLIGAEAGSGVAGFNGIFQGPGYFYLIALAYVFFGGDPIGAQIFMLLFGLAAMIIAAWVGLKTLGRVGSMVFLFFVTVSPLIVSQSRFIWSSHPVTSFVILALYFVFRIPKKPKIFAPLAVFTAVFAYHFQLGVTVPLVVALFLSFPLVYRIFDWKVYVYCFAAVFLAFSPMIVFEMRHGFMAVKSVFGATNGAGLGGLIFDPIRLSSHVFDYWNNFYNTFTFEFGWIPRGIQMLILYATLPFLGIGLWFAKPRRFVLFLLLLLVTTWAGYLFLNNTVWDYYLTHTRITYIFLYVIAILALLRIYKRLFVAKIGLMIFGIFLITIAVGSAFRQYISYTVDIRDIHVYEKIQGKKLVIDTIYDDAKGEKFSVFVFMPSVYTHPYDYLFKTYAKKRYGYEPNHQKQGLAYLIIEPDFSQIWRHKGWLETVVNGGETIWTKTILNSLILEKRMY